MTHDEKLTALKAMVGGSDTDEVLSAYLNLAGGKIIAKAYPYKSEVTEVPADSFTAVTPTMSFAVDTSALKYYDSGSFAKSVSANVTSNTSVTATGFMEGMEEFYREYVEPTMAQMAADMRRQADKNEQTIVQIGNRTVSDAVTTQQKANGFVFAK